MNIYISGISGTAMGPLAIFAKEAGMEVCGSDRAEGAVTKELAKAKISYLLGNQDGRFLEKKIQEGKVDWFVYTSALPEDHPEIVMAQKYGVKISKRDELIAKLIEELKLKMIGVAGTHGKTTTTAAIVWCCKKLGLPVSYLVGTTLGFAGAGEYVKGSEYLVYEADEYDRNFLHYHPWLAVITSVSYDHPDIYKTKAEYQAAFAQYIRQSKTTIIDAKSNPAIKLAGEVRRYDATLALMAVKKIAKDAKIMVSEQEIIDALNQFPGVGRRFEKICDGVYSDYAHHPEEVKATVDVAKEQAKLDSKKGVVVLYEPHQNVRQHEVMKGYKDAFVGVDKLLWAPTFLVREDPNLTVLKPRDFIETLTNKDIAEPAEFGMKLEKMLKKYQEENYLIVLMSAGPADKWLRKIFC